MKDKTSMTTKFCFKCNLEKPIEDYYKHKGMFDGHLNKCKSCTKKDTKDREANLLLDPEWVKNEQARHREKYYRLGYKEKHKPSKEKKREIVSKYKRKYPEKIAATNAVGKYPRQPGEELHHWSYNDCDKKDVIPLNSKDHAKAHRFILYDQVLRMYRRYDTGEILDTKEKHEAFIKMCIETKED